MLIRWIWLVRLMGNFCLLLLSVTGSAAEVNNAVTPTEHQQFRDAVIQFVRADALAYLSDKPAVTFVNPAYDHAGRWTTSVQVYLDGVLRGTGRARAKLLSQALHTATVSALSGANALLSDALPNARFVVSFEYPPHRVASIVDFEGHGFELLGNVTAVRTLNRAVIEQQLQRAKHYLLAIKDPVLSGFPKSYDAATDVAEPRLRTIYTASSLFTLLKMAHWQSDPDIDKQIVPIANYLLSQQCKDAPCKGAFQYSYYPALQLGDKRYLVGTTSKTIFTLLELWHKTNDQRYRDAAVAAGNWLVSMVNPDGTVNAASYLKNGNWKKKTRFSLLYSGQVLSALSRLYKVKADEQYRNAAERIAGRFRSKMLASDTLLGDEYREANSVSTSWVAKALFDYSRIDSNMDTHRAIFRAIDLVLNNQVQAPQDPYYDGSIFDDPSTSGTGWINEVLIDVNHLCLEDDRTDCARYRTAMRHATRWLIQHSYAEPNTFALRNPHRALGGAIRNYDETVVRTDAVCHGNNSLIGLLELEGDAVELTLPEVPFPQFFRRLHLNLNDD